jgi:Domain of unknown function (DUF4267)
MIAFAIVVIGARFLITPATAANGYGVDAPASSLNEVRPWLSVKGVRDIVSGLFLAMLMANGATKLVGEFLLIASLIAWGDAVIVLRSGGRRAAAFGIHGATALLIMSLAQSSSSPPSETDWELSTQRGESMKNLERFTPYVLFALRIMAGLLFMQHGLQKLLMFPAPSPHGKLLSSCMQLRLPECGVLFK